MKVTEMTRDELLNWLDAHGADLSRWPIEQRGEAERLIAADAGARDDVQAAARLDAMLARFAGTEDERSAARILTKLNGPLPRQKQPFWRLPAALLDWQFAPAWPRVAALAGCALVGFSIGIAGVDRSLATPDTQIASHDIGTMVFGPELFAETRP